MKVEIGGHEHPAPGDYVQADAFGSPHVFADLRALPFRGVEELYASHVLEHIPDVDVVPALKECRRALARGGRLVLYVPDLPWMMRRFIATRGGNRWALWGRLIYGSHETPGLGHCTGFDTQRLADCLLAAGFREIETKRVRRKERHKLMEIRAEARP